MKIRSEIIEKLEELQMALISAQESIEDEYNNINAAIEADMFRDDDTCLLAAEAYRHGHRAYIECLNAYRCANEAIKYLEAMNGEVNSL